MTIQPRPCKVCGKQFQPKFESHLCCCHYCSRHYQQTKPKICFCGRPAVGRTAGLPVCARCLEIERRHSLIVKEREERKKRIAAKEKAEEVSLGKFCQDYLIRTRGRMDWKGIFVASH